MTASTQTNTTPFPWEKWAQLPKEEREAEMKEALKENNQDVDPVTGETVGNSGVTPTPPFPYWDVAGPTTETEAVGGHFFDAAEPEAAGSSRRNPRTVFELLTLPFLDVAEPTRENEAVGDHFVDTAEPETVGHRRGLFPLPDFSDQSANVDEQQNAQVDAVTGYGLNNDNAISFDRFQIHHDDGIMDGYLDTAEGEFNSNPQTLTPINLDFALATDAYQKQDAQGADLIAGEANRGIDPYQAQREQYEVLA